MAIQRKQRRLRWVVRVHAWITFFSFSAYLGLGFFLGPEFLYSDIRKRFFASADDTIVVTAVVPGPPATPVVTATPSCVSETPRITLDWADDDGTTKWDISRDSTPLTTSLTVAQYVDTAIVAGVSYRYIVTATGPMFPGTAASSTVVAVAPDCDGALPITVVIQSIGGQSVATDRTDIVLMKTRPRITGNTNIAGATIDIVLTEPDMSVRLSANANGYFEWVPSMRLDTGRHLLKVVATNPANSDERVTDSFIFRTQKTDEKSAEDKDEEGEGVIAVEGVPASELPINVSDFDFSVLLDLNEGAILQGSELTMTILARKGSFPEDATIDVFLEHATDRLTTRWKNDVSLTGQSHVTLTETIPEYLEAGDYVIRVDIVSDGETVTRYAPFKVREFPLLALGGQIFGYTEVASLLGTTFFISVSVFLFSLTLLVREYWLYLHSLRAIVAVHLWRVGLIASRKGVIR